MSLHILIDGYNLIRQSPDLRNIELRNLQEGREALLDRLAAYMEVKKHRITVVFDGMYAGDVLERRTTWRGINVIFSRHGESADDVIKRMVKKEREKVVVVTSDREIAGFAYHRGAATISSPEFEHKMKMASYLEAKGLGTMNGYDAGWSMTTRKKGPSRRLSKRERRNKIKTDKL